MDRRWAALFPGATLNDENGEFVMGKQNFEYDRQFGLGYKNRCSSPSRACSSEQHPNDWGGEDSGNYAVEEWAELFMNFIMGGFADDPAGRARQSWTAGIINKLLGTP